MSLPDSRLAYTDCFEMFEQALKDPAGVRVGCDSDAAAYHMRFRMHKARSIDRKDNFRTYDRDHHMSGKSTYDQFVIRVREDTEGKFWMYIEREVLPTMIEPLSEVGDA